MTVPFNYELYTEDERAEATLKVLEMMPKLTDRAYWILGGWIKVILKTNRARDTIIAHSMRFFDEERQRPVFTEIYKYLQDKDLVECDDDDPCVFALTDFAWENYDDNPVWKLLIDTQVETADGLHMAMLIEKFGDRNQILG